MVVSIRTGRALVAAASLALLGACEDKPNNLVIPVVATTLSINSGSSGQTAVVGTALANPISVHVSDATGNSVSGVTVTWTVVDSGGSTSATTTVTDVNGNTSVTWTLGLKAGQDSLVASLANGVSVTITATATAAAFHNLVLVSGDAQSVVAGSTTAPFVVHAVDVHGNSVSGVVVAWTTTGGGTLSSTSTTTDVNGLTSVTLTTSATPGAFTVTATSGTAPAITFHGTGT